MKVLGIDFGEKRIGLALGDSKTKVCVPFDILENKGEEFVFNFLRDLILKENIRIVVLGLPRSFNNKENKQTKVIKKFAEKLFTRLRDLDIKIIFEDENWTTNYAKSLIAEYKTKNRKYYDDISAMLILQTYFERF